MLRFGLYDVDTVVNRTIVYGGPFISGKTVSNHISHIFAKLHVADRARAIVAAREAGLGRRGNRR